MDGWTLMNWILLSERHCQYINALSLGIHFAVEEGMVPLLASGKPPSCRKIQHESLDWIIQTTGQS